MDVYQIVESGVLDNKKVLVAEDNPANQLVLKKLLKKVNIEPVFAENGQEALEYCKSDPESWDLILMDCEMPVMDGYTATEAIRQFEQEAGIEEHTIIGLSAHAIDELKNKALSRGMDDYLTKPIERDYLFQTLVDYLG
ncbi:response regulator [Endozoicomonas sp. 8E]|uniref:response regulator n=1 Tax=Endozoicomonas sp. 8E TaxID=3035692 RepID=UPI0029391874|nr:response regulator [Endozoicomonas sp. 8E]WOG26626.1 response regulator [Endozoicomonas sp. 8E]